MNGRNKSYIVLFENDRFHPELHYSACRNKFNNLPEARKFASKYENAYIFCAEHFRDSGDIKYFTMVS